MWCRIGALVFSLAVVLAIGHPALHATPADPPAGSSTGTGPPATSETAAAPRLDFGVTADDFGVVSACSGLTPLTSQFVFTQSIVFGSAISWSGSTPPPAVIVSDGACAPACRSAGEPPFRTDWWCQFREGLAPGELGCNAGVNQFSAELCYIDNPLDPAPLMIGMDLGGTVIDVDEADPGAGSSQVLSVQDPLLAHRIQVVNVIASTDLGGLTVDRLEYDEPSCDIGTAVGDLPPATDYFTRSYPNPFNRTVTIEYGVGQRTHVSIDVFDVKGRRVRSLVNAEREPVAGGHSVTWDGLSDTGEALPSGVYFYTLVAGDIRQTRKVVFLTR